MIKWQPRLDGGSEICFWNHPPPPPLPLSFGMVDRRLVVLLFEWIVDRPRDNAWMGSLIGAYSSVLKMPGKKAQMNIRRKILVLVVVVVNGIYQLFKCHAFKVV